MTKEWGIIGSDSIDRPKSRYETKNWKVQESTDAYTDAVYIPITNAEGIAMHDKALNIREKPGYYNLYNHNCN